MRTGLHRARGETTKPIERSHVPVKDRLRPMRGLQSVRTGGYVIETVEAMQALRRGVHQDDGATPRSAHERARVLADRIDQFAAALRSSTR